MENIDTSCMSSFDLNKLRTATQSITNRPNIGGKPQRFKIVNGLRIDNTLPQDYPLIPRKNLNDTTRFITSSSQIGNSHSNHEDNDMIEERTSSNPVLRYYGYFIEIVHESPEEIARVRKIVILYYLEDNSIQILEPKDINSGIPQGVFLKRGKFSRPDGHYYSLLDFEIGKEITIYGRIFKLYDCDLYTRNYYLKEKNIKLKDSEIVPKDQHTKDREKIKQLFGAETDHYYGKKNSSLKTFMEASLGNPQARASAKGDKKKKFLENSRKVLQFKAEYDETGRLYGELLHYSLNYFLEDDTIEIKETYKPNTGKDPFPLLVKRCRLPKEWMDSLRDEQDRGVSEPTPDYKYYNVQDLYIGAIINVFNRPLKLVDADPFTRDYYKEIYNITFGSSIQTPEQVASKPAFVPPPYTGYGTEEDSLGSCNTLIPKVPKTDFKKFIQYDRQVLRFSAKFATTKNMRKEQQERNFIITFYLADDSISVYEPEQRNSGIVGGKFLERGQHKNNIGNKITKDDFIIGNELSINSYNFILIDSDEYTKTHILNNK